MEESNQKHIAFVFSILFPGGGFFYEKKWLTGIVFASIHLLLSTLLFYKGVLIIYYRTSGLERGYEDIAILILIVFSIFLNWIFNIRKLLNY
ncbi:MAG: hypothetical protein K0R34_2524 [Herbinix sp.]|jgi:hypothetical protein|nr:hypothetical protein [Herbinix sp.]